MRATSNGPTPTSTVDYEVIADNETGDTAFEDEVDGRASLSVFAPAVSSGDFIAMDPGDSGLLDLAVDIDSQADAPSLGWMIVALDDQNGAPQADLVPVGDLPTDRSLPPRTRSKPPAPPGAS